MMIKEIAWKSYHELLSNTEFALEKNSLFEGDTFNGADHLKDNDIVRLSIYKMKNRKAAEPSGLVSEIMKPVGEATRSCKKDKH